MSFAGTELGGIQEDLGKCSLSRNVTDLPGGKERVRY